MQTGKIYLKLEDFGKSHVIEPYHSLVDKIMRNKDTSFHGTCPENKRTIQSIIDSKIPTITNKAYNINCTNDFARLFKEREPIVQFSIPEFYVNIYPFSWDKRFI